jgi:hypothetical protein
MSRSPASLFAIFAFAFMCTAPRIAWAHPLYAGTPSPVFPVPGAAIPSPLEVPGKEYTDFTDEDHVGAADPGQNVAGGGLGGNGRQRRHQWGVRHPHSR